MADKKTIKTITTSSGFKCRVDANKLDDMRLFENIILLQEEGDEYTKLKASLELLTDILGKEQKEKLYKHLEDTEGKASTLAFRRELTEIFSALGDNKKK